MRRRVDSGEPQGDRPDEVAQLKPRQRRGEQDEDMAAAGRRDVGDVMAAEALEQLAELGGLAADGGGTTFMAVPDSSIVNVTASAGRIEVKRQHPAGAELRGRRPAP